MDKVYLIIIIAAFIMSSCNQQEAIEDNYIAKVEVKTTKIENGYIPDYINLSGKSIYLNKNNIVAPISGYVTKTNIQQGDYIKKGEVLFEMQTSESYLMQKGDTINNNYGAIKIYAPVSGKIDILNIANKNVFVEKAINMCNILSINDLKIEIDVPYEYNSFVKIGNSCKIILPDNTEIEGRFTKYLPKINENSQTIKVLSEIKSKIFIPENMIIKVMIDKSKKHQAQILPKQCLQTDALMTNYWVMKLINDSTAIKINVNIGNKSHNQVEILNPIFKSSDKIIIEGAYGLSDTVLVKEINETN